MAFAGEQNAPGCATFAQRIADKEAKKAAAAGGNHAFVLPEGGAIGPGGGIGATVDMACRIHWQQGRLIFLGGASSLCRG